MAGSTGAGGSSAVIEECGLGPSPYLRLLLIARHAERRPREGHTRDSATPRDSPHRTSTTVVLLISQQRAEHGRSKVARIRVKLFQRGSARRIAGGVVWHCVAVGIAGGRALHRLRLSRASASLCHSRHRPRSPRSADSAVATRIITRIFSPTRRDRTTTSATATGPPSEPSAAAPAAALSCHDTQHTSIAGRRLEGLEVTF